uniref:Uncharacterized protein n=1 Tax=Triticum urartu TaxID=4572 RepID=A0A8R7Q5Y3_TRIUA
MLPSYTRYHLKLSHAKRGSTLELKVIVGTPLGLLLDFHGDTRLFQGQLELLLVQIRVSQYASKSNEGVWTKTKLYIKQIR